MTPSERKYYGLGRQHFERGDVAAGIAQLTKLLQTRKDFADVHFMLGVLFERADDTESAARSLREALRINPGMMCSLSASKWWL